VRIRRQSGLLPRIEAQSKDEELTIERKKQQRDQDVCRSTFENIFGATHNLQTIRREKSHTKAQTTCAHDRRSSSQKREGYARQNIGAKS
jgi:hypothetical protein